MSEHYWWYIARASGLVAWLALAAAMAWGMLLSTGLLQSRKRPAWLLDLHGWLGTLAITFTGMHLTALALDDYVQFRLRDFLVPLTSEWHPMAVAWGVIGLYLLVGVQLSSWLVRHLPRRLWRAIHLTSFGAFWVVSIHAAAAGTDTTATWYRVGSTAMLGLLLFVAAYRMLAGGRPHRRSPLAGRPPA